MTAALPGPAGEPRADPAERVEADIRALGLSASASQLGQLVGYLGLLQRWNATYNLTAVREPAAMRVQHLADCLSLVGPLLRWRTSGRLLDVGSGGGLPGVVIATMASGWNVTCCDTVGKKAAFVRQCAGALGLANLHAEHARVEGLRLPAFDVLCSRAFASLADFTRLTRHLLAPGGVWLAMKGRRPDEEVAELPSDVVVFHVEPLAVPGLDAERCLVWMRLREASPGAPSAAEAA